MANKYEIVNASDAIFNRPAAKDDGMVQPNTRRTLDLSEEMSDALIESYASAGVFIKKSTAAAQNGEPLPGMEPEIAEARTRLMVAVGDERKAIIDSLHGGKKLPASTSSAKASAPSSAGAAPSAAPAPTAATGPAT